MTPNNPHHPIKEPPFRNYGPAARLALLGVLFIASLMLLAVVSAGASAFLPAGRTLLMLSAAAQDILCFALPAWALARPCGGEPARVLGLDRGAPARAWLGVVAVGVLAWPAMEQIVAWNEALPLAPDSMFRRMEQEAQAATDMLLGDASVWGLISGVLVVGVLTGLCEEMFFRGGVQRVLREGGLNRHVAVWSAALIFSALHFQLLGFVPRMLMGAFFGYLYVWSGSLWLPAAAHALNNSVVVIVSWISLHTGTDYALPPTAMPWLAAASAGATAAVLVLWRRRLFFTRKDQSDGCKG